MMFEVEVAANKWRIRTEPVIQGQGGIGYYEAAYTTNDSVFKLTVLESAYRSSESPFGSLQAELKKAKREDVYFTNTSRIEVYSSSNSSLIHGRSTNAPVGMEAANHIHNVAVAVEAKGKFPPVDSSYVATLWFAFTPPNGQMDGTNKMLLQIWDDGNPQKTRFRRASWKQLTEYPNLVSDAVYGWAGKQLLPDGYLDDLKKSGWIKPESIAAHYEVNGVTNVDGLTLPLNFKLTRFNSKRLGSETPKIETTIEASVVKAGRFSSGRSLDVHIPGKTVVSDYRLSRQMLDSNSPPTQLLKTISSPSNGKSANDR